MDRRRRQIIEQNNVSEVHSFVLGGVQQKVLIEGRSKDLPIVICLHGGPGTPIPFSVGCRGMFPEFTDKFIMVYWDQLGCGINDYKLKDEFEVASFVQMTEDLIIEIKKMFPQNRLLLFGMSWGSVLALKTVQNPERRVDAVVVWGQVLRKLFLNEEVYAALESAGLSERKMKRIRAVTPENFTDKDMQLVAGSVRKHTDGNFCKKGEKVSMGPIIRGLLTSPDYRFKDFKAIMINGTATSTRLWPELLRMDLTEELKNVGIPYYIIQGDTDIVTSTKDVQQVVADVHNPHVSCQVIVNQGHMPGKEGMDAVYKTLLSVATTI